MDTLYQIMQKKYWLLFSIILAGSTVLYLLIAGGKYVWADEAYTFAMIGHSYAEIWRITAVDVHPPLYYFILKALTKFFNYSLFSAKVVSILPFIFIIAFGGVQLKRLFNEKVSLYFMALFFAFPFSLTYSIEIRMYSLAAAFVFANAVYAYRCFLEDNKRNWLFFALSGAGAAYTHYFALVSAGIIYILLFVAIMIRKKEKSKLWILASLLTAILYLPWLNNLVGQLAYRLEVGFWVDDITVFTLLSYCLSIFGAGGLKTFALFSSLTYLAALLYILHTKNRNLIWLCVCALLVPILTIGIGVAASILIRPVFVVRYCIPSIPLLVFFMALSLSEMKHENLVVSILTIVIMGGISSYGTAIYGEYLRFDTEKEISEAFVQKYEIYDGYVVALESTTHPAGILAYWEKEKPIYYNVPAVGESSPFANLLPLHEFHANNPNSVIMLLDVGKLPPAEFTNTYQYEYAGEVHAHGIPADAFLLTKIS